jgi:hypothetical protein
MPETSPPLRRQGPFILGLVLILAALPLGYFFFLREVPPAPPSVAPVAPPAPVVEAPAPEKPVQLQITEVSGTVQVKAKNGSWQNVDKGTMLTAADEVRTVGGSYAVIIGGESVMIRMEPGTEVTVEELTASVSRLLLNKGMATTTVLTGKGHTIEFKAKGSDAVATAKDQGTFTMSNDGAGTVAVGAREGEVAFRGNKQVVIVKAGYQSVLRPGDEGPSAPMKVPTSLLRKLTWPGRQQNKDKIVVKGEAEPGTRVEVAGETIYPGKDGTFEKTVGLKEGENDVRVRAVSVVGKEEEQQRKFSVDTRPPVTHIPSLWKDSGGQ